MSTTAIQIILVVAIFVITAYEILVKRRNVGFHIGAFLLTLFILIYMIYRFNQ